eukprot:scaffold81812_cov34-Prasinocladus_malaysianus.AAC.1
MLIPRQYARDALSGPLLDFRQMQDQMPKLGLRSPEMYLKESLVRRGVPVKQQGPDFMPITDGRCESGNFFCVVRSEKDCRPTHTTERWPSCKFTYLQSHIKQERKRMTALGVVQ